MCRATTGPNWPQFKPVNVAKPEEDVDDEVGHQVLVGLPQWRQQGVDEEGQPADYKNACVDANRERERERGREIMVNRQIGQQTLGLKLLLGTEDLHTQRGSDTAAAAAAATRT